MPSARRLLTIGGAAFVGIAATAMFAAPASAHAASGDAVACKTTTGSWLVAWKVTNDFGNAVTLTNLNAKPGAIDGIGNDARIEAKGTITGTQELDENGIKEAKLSYVAKWDDDFTARKQTITPELKGDCTPGGHKPPGCKPHKPGDGGDKGKPCPPPCTPGTGDKGHKPKPPKPSCPPEGTPTPQPSESTSPSPSGGTGGGGESPTPSPSKSTPPSLPVTGSQAAIYGGGSVLLLGAGTGLFFAARRRRISFEA
jgi:hypothetical protein